MYKYFSGDKSDRTIRNTRILRKVSARKQCLCNSAIKMGAVSDDYQNEDITHLIKRPFFSFLYDFILHFQITLVFIFLISILGLICYIAFYLAFYYIYSKVCFHFCLHNSILVIIVIFVVILHEFLLLIV